MNSEDRKKRMKGEKKAVLSNSPDMDELDRADNVTDFRRFLKKHGADKTTKLLEERLMDDDFLLRDR